MAVVTDVQRVVPEVCRHPVQVPAGSTSEVDDEMLAGMTKALGHPTQVRILRLLAERRARAVQASTRHMPRSPG